jgi:hypothetical protein
MRRLLILVVVGAVALAGCGSSSSGSSSPVNTELSYLPVNSSFVATIETDPNGAAIKGANALISRFSFGGLAMAALKQKLQQQGINYDADLRPLFGNPVALAVTGSVSGVSNTAALVVWITKDAAKLKSLITKAVSGSHSVGSHEGVTLYEGKGAGAYAVDSATLISGTSLALVTAALDRHAHGGGITSSQYRNAMSGLPQDALVKTFGNLTGALSQASAANARKVPWVAALKAYSATVTAGSAGLSFDFHLDTTGGSLTTAQLPFAPGTTAPGFAGSLPITFAVHDPAEIASFIESAQQVTSPAGYADFLKRQAVTRAKTGVDLNSLIKVLTGDLVISSDTKMTMGRVGVTDSTTAAQTLAKLVSVPRALDSSARSVTKIGDFYEIKDSKGSVTRIGIVGSQLVVGNASAAALQQFASETPAPAAGAKGSVAFRIGLVPLLQLAMHSNSVPQAAQAILTSLGDITGWASSSTSGITGDATIAVK